MAAATVPNDEVHEIRLREHYSELENANAETEIRPSPKSWKGVL
jgi:hypothetical protein